MAHLILIKSSPEELSNAKEFHVGDSIYRETVDTAEVNPSEKTQNGFCKKKKKKAKCCKFCLQEESSVLIQNIDNINIKWVLVLYGYLSLGFPYEFFFFCSVVSPLKKYFVWFVFFLFCFFAVYLGKNTSLFWCCILLKYFVETYKLCSNSKVLI